MDPDEAEPMRLRDRRIGAMEGTGFGLLLAGAIMGMVWLGHQFGSVLRISEGRYAALFLAAGAVILAIALRREPAEQ